MPVPPRPHAGRPPRPLRRRPSPAPDAAGDPDDWPIDRGRPLGLRLLGLVGALAFVMLGLSVVVPLLQPQPQAPPAQGGAGTTT